MKGFVNLHGKLAGFFRIFLIRISLQSTVHLETRTNIRNSPTHPRAGEKKAGPTPALIRLPNRPRIRFLALPKR